MKLSKNTLYVHIPQHVLFFIGLAFVATQKVSWLWLVYTYLSWIVLGYFGFSVFYHRYFAHRAFKMNRFWEIIWAYLGLLVGRGSPINLASLHCAEHHLFADTEKDPHSPNKGYLWSWFTWSEHHTFKVSHQFSKHLVKDEFIRYLDRNYLKIYWLTFFVLTLLSWKLSIFCMAGAGVLHFHIEGAVSTLCHSPKFGSQDYPTGDNSRNLRGLFNIILLGTGLHNNHHAFPKSFHYAIQQGDFDLAKYVVPLFIKKNAEV